MENDMVLYQVTERIAEITLNRPDKRNALNPALVEALKIAFTSAKNDDDVKVIILKAAGEVFSAGADLAYLQQLQRYSYEENLVDSMQLKELFELIRSLNKVVIAQVEGHAIAGGCGLASICDFIFAVPEAKFGYTEVKLGFVPAIVSCYLVPKIGETLSKRLLLSGELISADEAQKINLISYVTKSAEINLNVKEFALHLCLSNSSNAMAETKALINYTQNSWLDDCLQNAVAVNAKVRLSSDFQKGINAFVNKEQINW
jgi:methylglutaconyl-CoA hydratase